MWVFMNSGFVSVVKDREDGSRLIVRARRPEVLKSLFPDEGIAVSDHSDYRYRTHVSRHQFVAVMSRAIQEIDYSNFKSSVSDCEILQLYHEIWALGLGYQR